LLEAMRGKILASAQMEVVYSRAETAHATPEMPHL
jgi:hypothetical protein